MQHRAQSRPPARSGMAILAALALLLTPAFRAQGQTDPLADLGDPVDTINAPLREIPEERRAELLLLPAIAGMDDSPAAAEDPREAIMLIPADEAWAAAAAWAEAEPQRASLEALRSATEEDAQLRLALLYGAQGADSLLRETGLLIRLSEGGLLAGADLNYLNGFDRLLALAAVEAERLAADGRPDEAIDLFIRGVRLARLVSDRAYFREVEWSLQRMALLMEGLRDIAFRYEDALSVEALTGVVEALNDEALRIDRIELPEADRLAALQVVRETFQRFGEPDPARFGAVMGAVARVERPLARFGEASWWRRLGDRHAGYYGTIDAINAVYGDWSLRWSLRPFDPVLDNPTEYEKLDPALHAAVLAVVPDLGRLFTLRRELRVAQQGTRTAAAIVAYKVEHGVHPRPLSAIRPAYIYPLPLDPLAEAQVHPFRFFVPIRDQPRGERESPEPHTIQLITQAPETTQRQVEEAISAINAIPDEQLEPLGRPMAQAVQDLIENESAPQETAAVFAQQITGALGDTIDEQDRAAINQAVADALERFTDSPDFQALAQAAGRRRSLDPPQVKQLLRLSTRMVLQALEEARFRRRLEENPSMATSIELDDSVFLLYSVGADQVPGFGETVGPGGKDVLIWPPVISLIREHLEGAPGGGA